MIDANIVMAMLIRPGVTHALVEEHELCAPTYLFEELERHLDLIIRKSSLSRTALTAAMETLRARVAAHPPEGFSHRLAEASRICPDPKDVPYFALALHLGCPIWSNDKALRRQDAVQVIATDELLGR